MPLYKFGTAESVSPKWSGVPQVVADFLEHGAPEGMRNSTLFHVACQYRDMSGTEDEAINALLPRALEIGLQEREARSTIHSAYTHERRDPAARPGVGNISVSPRAGVGYIDQMLSKMRGGKVTRLTQADGVANSSNYILAEESELPAPIPDPTRAYLKALFRPGERVCIVRAKLDTKGKEEPHAAEALRLVKGVEEWLEALDQHDGEAYRAIYPAFDPESEPHGLYVCINPLRGDNRVTENVTDFRHALVEWDDPELPRHKQWQLIEQSKLPCVAVVNSGGKSIHAVVRVDAKDKVEFKQRVNFIYAHFGSYKVDPQNCDPPRLTRLPGPVREDTKSPQALLSLKMGLESFEEWQQYVLAEHSLPPEVTLDELEAFDSANDPDNLIGRRWLCRGGSAVISGQSGTGKSSLLMQMAITWALGQPFFGIRPMRPLRALIIQAENDKGDLAEAYQGIRDGMGLTAEDKNALRRNLRFHRDTIHTGEKFISMAARLIAKHKPDVVFADPLLSFVGGDISKQEVAGAFLRNGLGPVLLQSGVIWIFLHHSGKPGDKDARKSWNVKDKSYLMLGSSEITNWAREVMILERIGKDADLYQFTLSKRGARAGMLDENEQPAQVIHLQHAQGRICWVRPDYGDEGMKAAMEEHLAGGKRAKGQSDRGYKMGRPKKAMDESARSTVQVWLMEHGGCSVSALIVQIEQICDCSKPTARSLMEQLQADGFIEITEPEQKGAQAACNWSLSKK